MINKKCSHKEYYATELREGRSQYKCLDCGEELNFDENGEIIAG